MTNTTSFDGAQWREHDLFDPLSERGPVPGCAPGKSTLTARLPSRPPEVRAAERVGRIDRQVSGEPIEDGADEAVTRARSGSATGLEPSLRGHLEAALGVNLGGVSVHTDAAAGRAASSIGASAYAEGQDVYFGAGQYDPASAGGRRLIAHEVAHTVQQRGGATGVQASRSISEPGDAHEREADAFADAFVAGRTAPVTAAAPMGVTHRAANNDRGDEDFGSLEPSEQKRRFKKADVGERAKLLGLVSHVVKRTLFKSIRTDEERVMLLASVKKNTGRACLAGAELNELGRLFDSGLGSLFALPIYRMYARSELSWLLAATKGVIGELFVALTGRERNAMVNEAPDGTVQILAQSIPTGVLMGAWSQLDDRARIILFELLPEDKQNAVAMTYEPQES